MKIFKVLVVAVCFLFVSVFSWAASRVVWITEAINQSTSHSAVSQLMTLDSQNHQMITIVLDSPGGSIVDGLFILEAMDMCTSPIRTVSFRNSSSMASFILAHGKKGERYIDKYSGAFIHNMSMTFMWGLVLTEADLDQLKIIFARDTLTLLTILSKDTGKPITYLKNLMNQSRWFWPEEVIKEGYADKYVTTALLRELYSDFVPPDASEVEEW